MFTETYTIKLQFSQQGPIRYNSRVSSYNPRAVRRDAARQLPHTGTVQRLSPAVRPRIQWYATPVLNLLPYTGQWRLKIESIIKLIRIRQGFRLSMSSQFCNSSVLEIIGSNCSNETRTRVTSFSFSSYFCRRRLWEVLHLLCNLLYVYTESTDRFYCAEHNSIRTSDPDFIMSQHDQTWW